MVAEAAQDDVVLGPTGKGMEISRGGRRPEGPLLFVDVMLTGDSDRVRVPILRSDDPSKVQWRRVEERAPRLTEWTGRGPPASAATQY